MQDVEMKKKDVPLHKTAQRLRWFVAEFKTQVSKIGDETGNAFKVDETKLTEVFAEWLKEFISQKPSNPDDNLEYVGFAAGLMLRALIRHQPIRTVSVPDAADKTNPAYFWPEGYAYVAFCLNVRGLVIKADFDHEQHPSAVIDDLRTWWSFKENVEQDPTQAIGFLDLFAGDQPEWTMCGLFKSGQIHSVAERFYTNDKPEKLE